MNDPRKALFDRLQRLPARVVNGSVQDAIDYKKWWPKAMAAVRDARTTEAQLHSLINHYDSLQGPKK